ncbi:MAG: acyl carrier protein [Colwellia sp.]
MNTVAKLQYILSKIINIPAESISVSMPLIGEYAELDSMGVMTLLMEIESNFDIDINDIDLSMETFTTLRSLQFYVESAIKSSV